MKPRPCLELTGEESDDFLMGVQLGTLVGVLYFRPDLYGTEVIDDILPYCEQVASRMGYNLEVTALDPGWSEVCFRQRIRRVQ